MYVNIRHRPQLSVGACVILCLIHLSQLGHGRLINKGLLSSKLHLRTAWVKNVSLSLSHVVSTEHQRGTTFVWQQLKNQLCLAAHSKTLPRTLPLVRHFLRYCLCTFVLAKSVFIPEPYSIMSVKHPWSFKKEKTCLVQLSRHCINYQLNHLELHAWNVVNFMTSRQFILVNLSPSVAGEEEDDKPLIP